MKNKKVKILILVFLLLVAQFAYSNFKHLIGTNYTLPFAIESFNRYTKNFSGTSGSGFEYRASYSNTGEYFDCEYNYAIVSTISKPPPRHSDRGFPFATDEVIDLCDVTGAYDSIGFQPNNIDRILNGAYIVVVISGFIFLFIKFDKSNNKAKGPTTK